MKQVIIRIHEAKVAELMDQFVGRIERVAGLLESSDEGDTKRVGVVAVFRHKGEQLQVLLGKREYDPEAGKYALPGGHIKEGEDLDTGTRREIKEETGLELDDLKKLRMRPGDDGETVHIYGSLYTGTERAEADDETAGVKWMNVADLPEGLAWDNNELIPKLAKEMALTETLSKAKPDVTSIVARAQYKADRLKRKGWTQKDFHKVLYGGPSVQKEVNDEVKARQVKEAYAGFNAAELNSNQPLPAKRTVVYKTLHQPWAMDAAKQMRERFGINVWVDGTVTTGWKVLVHAGDGERAYRMLRSLPPGGNKLGFIPGVHEALDVRSFIQGQPTFNFKHDQFHGLQVFVDTRRPGSWPLPIGAVNKDPDGKWFIVSGRVLGTEHSFGGPQWKWWDNEFPREPNQEGGIYGPRFEDKEAAALHLWLRFKEAK